MMKWYGDIVMRRLEDRVGTRLDAAAIYVQRFAMKLVSEGGGPRGRRSGASKSERHANRSTPWMPPHRDTGHLMRNIGWDRPAPGVRRVGTGIGGKQQVGYAMFLEFGTRRMLPRPWLRPSIYYTWPAVRAILAGKNEKGGR